MKKSIVKKKIENKKNKIVECILAEKATIS
jgi:hypothetical protein